MPPARRLHDDGVYDLLDNTIRRAQLTCDASVELANRGKISLGAVGDRPIGLDEKYLYVIDSTLNQVWAGADRRGDQRAAFEGRSRGPWTHGHSSPHCPMRGGLYGVTPRA